MNIEKLLSDNLFLIVPDGIKNKIVEQISLTNKFYSYKIVGISELKKLVLFDYDIEAIIYVKNKEKVKSSIAIEYIETMFYLENKQYKSETLNKLVQLKNELDNNHLLIKDTKIKKILNNKNIVVYGFDLLTKEDLFVLSKLGNDYRIIDKESNNKDNEVQLYHFITLDDEVESICISISKLLNEGIDINKIKIANVNDDYNFALKRYFKMFNIPINIENKENLYSLISIKNFVNTYTKTKSLEKALDEYQEKYGLDDIYPLLLGVCNRFVGYDYDKTIDLFIDELNKTKLPSVRYDNAVEIIDLDNYIFDDEYVFALSLNQSVYPRTYRNDDFLDDEEKKELGIDTSEDLNGYGQVRLQSLLNNCHHLIMSYKESSSFNTYTKSFLLNKLKIKETPFIIDKETSYSILNDKLKLAQTFDKIEIKNEDEYLNKLYSSYKLDYRTYSNTFSGIDNQLLKDYLHNKYQEGKLTLSYTSLNNFYNCGFKYYLDKILDLISDEETVALIIGNVFHRVLERRYKDDVFDFDKAYDEEINKKDVDIVSKVYLDKLKDGLKRLIEINDKNEEESKLNYKKVEKGVAIDFKDKMKFYGKIDKILYGYRDGKQYYAIVDYKTGDTKFDISKIEHGLEMQLPIYLYLLHNDVAFKDGEACGIYIQHIIPKIEEYGKENAFEKNIKLDGYSNENPISIGMLDPHFEDSEMVKYNKKKLLSKESMDNLMLMTENKIKEAIDAIYDGKFDINPKMNEKYQDISCAFCPYKECCYVKFKDKMKLESSSNEEGGE